MISVMIPALNEEKNLGLTVETLIKAAKDTKVKIEVIIVNDGSKDRTQEVINKLERKYQFIRSIHHARNKGIGVSLKEVLKIAKYPKFFLIPADNVVAESLMKKLFLNRNKADFVLSYFINKEIRTRLRNIISEIYGMIFMNTFRTYVMYLNSVCLYPTKKIQKLDLFSRRYSISAEMTIKLLRRGCEYYEIPGLYLLSGQKTSTSLSLRNLFEVVTTYLRMVYEISVSQKDIYCNKPRRITDE